MNGIKESLKVGDSVLTHKGERGTIVKPWGRNDGGYDWWVEIEFTFQGKRRTTREPYRESELEKNSES